MVRVENMFSLPIETLNQHSGKGINIRLRQNLLDGKTFGNYLPKHGNVFNICSKLEFSDIHNG